MLTASPRALAALRESALPVDFANPAARVPRSTVVELLERCATMTGDPLLGLRAGAATDSGDGGVAEAAARTCATLGEALECARRHFRLLSDETELVLVDDGTTTTCEFRAMFPLHEQHLANDFAVASLLSFIERNTSRVVAPAEIRLAHERPVHASEYPRVFHCTRIIFNTEQNAVVIGNEHLSAPMVHSNPAAARAFDLHAGELVERLRSTAPTSRRVREQIARSLGDGTANMKVTAERLAMSEATLRRRLQDEGTTFADVLGDMRRELALHYLEEQSIRLSDIASRLGYGSATAFDRAFRRWTGATPGRYRDERLRVAARAAGQNRAHRAAS